jgi:hypothetical protein
VFKKLISRFQDTKASDHPLASDASLNALMADIPESDPRRLLFDIDEQLAGMEAAVREIGPTLALRALARLDQFSRPSARYLLSRYLSVGEREYLTDSVWSALDTHAGHQFRCYRSFLLPTLELPTDDDKIRIARCASRALMAWALRKKLQHFRYRIPTPEVWQDAHELLLVLNRLGLLKVRAAPYRNEEETTPLGEYLIGLYLEFVPISNLVPQQMEFAESVLRYCDGLDLSSQSDASSTHCIDLAVAKGPRRLQQGEIGGRQFRYCSVPKLSAPLMRLATQVRKPGAAPPWLAQVPASREQIESGISILMTYWTSTPPKRVKDRVAASGELRVMLGFGLARRMVAAAHFARMGRAFKYEGNDLDRIARQFEESRFGSVVGKDAQAAEDATEQVPEKAIEPIDILRRLETEGDRAQMEAWSQVDRSATGIGVVVPAVLPRHRIGLLICFCEANGIDWRMALIRRIGRDAENRPSIGIQTLGWPSICAQAKPAGEESVWTKVMDGGGHGWSDAIIVSLDGQELVLPAGAFFSGLEVDLRSEFGRWRVRLDVLLDHGPDYDRIKFSRIS